MQTEALKDVIASQLTPVRRIASPIALTLRFGFLVALVALPAIWLLELRLPFPQLLCSPLFLFDSALLVGMILTAFFTLVRLSLPALSSGKTELLLLFALSLIWIFRVIFGSVGLPESPSAIHPGYECAFPVLIMSTIIGPTIVLLTQALAPFRAHITAFLALFSAALVGTLVLHWVCPGTDTEHILLWHFLPALAIASVVAALGKQVFNI